MYPGKIRMHYIKILPGDKVTVELSPVRLNARKNRIALNNGLR